MGKIKKSKQNINVNGQLNANSVFDDLFNLFGRQERNFEDLEGILMEGLKHIGEENFVQELCLRLTKLQPEEDSTPIIWALEAIGNETVIRKLRNLLKNSDFSSRIHFEAGMVLTVEPGIYVPAEKSIPKKWQGIGIRIEDDVLVTRAGHEVLTDDAPKHPEAIEDLMASGE